MQSKIILEYDPSGTLVNSKVGPIYQGQVGTIDYLLKLDMTIFKISDIALIAFTRSDSAQAQRLMSWDAAQGVFRLTSNGWETDCEVSDDNGSPLMVGFVIQRYSKFGEHRASTVLTTGELELRVYPSAGFTPLHIDSSDTSNILAQLGELNGAIVSENTTNTAQQEAIDKLKTDISTENATNAKQQSEIGKLKTDIAAENATNAKQQGEIAALNADIAAENATNAKQQSEIGKLKTDIAAENATNAKQQGEIAALNALKPVIQKASEVNTSQDEAITGIKGDIKDIHDKKILVDFTVDLDSQTGTKHFSDGSTMVMTMPTGDNITNVVEGSLVIEFLASQFVENEYALSAAKTGMRNGNFVATVDKKLSSGSYTQTANALIKGSDGSVLITGAKPFNGRLVILSAVKMIDLIGNEIVTDISFNKNNGTFSIIKKDGSIVAIDTNLEKVAINFKYDQAAQALIITLEDGTEQRISLTSLVDTVIGADGAQVAIAVNGGKVSATLKDSSILYKHLASEIKDKFSQISTALAERLKTTDYPYGACALDSTKKVSVANIPAALLYKTHETTIVDAGVTFIMRHTGADVLLQKTLVDKDCAGTVINLYQYLSEYLYCTTSVWAVLTTALGKIIAQIFRTMIAIAEGIPESEVTDTKIAERIVANLVELRRTVCDKIKENLTFEDFLAINASGIKDISRVPINGEVGLGYVCRFSDTMVIDSSETSPRRAETSLAIGSTRMRIKYEDNAVAVTIEQPQSGGGGESAGTTVAMGQTLTYDSSAPDGWIDGSAIDAGIVLKNYQGLWVFPNMVSGDMLQGEIFLKINGTEGTYSAMCMNDSGNTALGAEIHLTETTGLILSIGNGMNMDALGNPTMGENISSVLFAVSGFELQTLELVGYMFDGNKYTATAEPISMKGYVDSAINSKALQLTNDMQSKLETLTATVDNKLKRDIPIIGTQRMNITFAAGEPSTVAEYVRFEFYVQDCESKLACWVSNCAEVVSISGITIVDSSWNQAVPSINGVGEGYMNILINFTRALTTETEAVVPIMFNYSIQTKP